MYGTVAKTRVKPGMQEGFKAWAAGTIGAARSVPGHVETIVYQSDADPNLLTVVVIFEDRESYHANAASPEQHAEFLKMMQFLASEPEWNDGEIIWRG